MEARRFDDRSILGFPKLQRTQALLSLLLLAACQAALPEPASTATAEIAPETMIVAASSATPEATTFVEQTSTATNTTLPTNIPEEVCVGSFHDFVFQIAEDGTRLVDGNGPAQQTIPAWPWREHSLLEYEQAEAPNLLWFSVAAVREIGEETEIWLYAYGDDLIIFRPDQQRYEQVSSTPVDEHQQPIPNLRLWQLHVNQRGKLWAQYAPVPGHGVNEFPLLSSYNANTGTFEAIPTIYIEYAPFDPPASASSPASHFVTLGSDGKFWIIHHQQAAVRFDPQTGDSVKYLELANMGPAEYAPSLNGGLYILKYPYADRSLDPGDLLHFDPQSRSLSPVALADETWPSHGRLHTSKDGKLWIGFNGYLSSDGEWNAINPFLQTYADSGSMSAHYQWDIPKFYKETSDGRLWFARPPSDGSGARGMAWYQPATGEGCWFIDNKTYPFSEDRSGRLWMVVGRQLYTLTLEP
jgi:hypothetical protein